MDRPASVGKKSTIRHISHKRQIELAYRHHAALAVIERDGSDCIRCGKRGNHVHEIFPKGFGGHKTRIDICYDERNMCVICMACHAEAATPKCRQELMRILHERHGYNYSGNPWREYWEYT